jgi:3'(2'), 5'-bisphosphate nucleotidase
MIEEYLHKLLFLAIKASLIASEEILEVYKTDFLFENKSDKSPVTLADKLANMAICKILDESGLPILSEEDSLLPYSERKNRKYLWIVDPLDGTKEFIKKNGEFTVNIALVRDGEPIMGVIFCPVTKELYFASPSVGGSFKVIPDNFIEITTRNIEKM